MNVLGSLSIKGDEGGGGGTLGEVFVKVGEDSGKPCYLHSCSNRVCMCDDWFYDCRLRRVNSAKVARPVSPIGQTRVTSPPNNMGIEGACLMRA